MDAWMRPLLAVTLGAALAGMAHPAAAAPFDGSRPFLCAVTTITECDVSGQCERQIPDGVNSPRFIRVDLGAQAISADGGKKSSLKSVTHVDGSARPQTVEREINSLYYRLIDEFGKITGVPVIMNTSFNLRGEAIVHTPTDAIRTFF